jgi:radical SAM superfamily enzyme YgiQ (UPF0313 family)
VRVTLISPPFLDPRAPYLALPSLTAYLRERGHRVTQTDLNARALSGLLSADYLLRTFPGDAHPAMAYCVENVDQAVNDLRDPDAFFDFPTYSRSRSILDTTLRVIAAHYPGASLNLRRIASVGGTFDEIVAAVLANRPTPFDPLYLESFVPEILAGDPDVVGISVSNGSQLWPALRLAQLVKASGARTILGGPVVTRSRDKIAKTPEFFEIADGAVIYEGEEALERLLDNIETGRPTFAGIRNCIFRDGARVELRNEPFALNLSALPTPDFEGLPFGDYLAPYPVLPLLSAKGCSWGLCTFCTIPDTSSSAGIKSRERPTAKVVDDLRTLKRRFGARHFVFVDEDISADRLDRLSRAIVASELEISWLAYSRFEKGHDPERCRTYRASGCRKLLMGLESASPRILRLMRKGITPQTVHRNLVALDEAGISVNVFCMVGFPSETRLEMESTMQFLRDRRHLLFKKGFSANFADFVLDEDSPVDVDPEKYGIEKGEGFNDWKFVGESADPETPEPGQLPDLRRRFSAELRDLYYPHEMIGWEEYTLLYDDAPGECRFPWRRPTDELKALVRAQSPSSLFLRKRPLLFMNAYTPPGQEPPGSCWLINLDSGYVLTVGRHVKGLLDEIDGWSDLATVVRRFAAHVGRDPSAVAESCTRLVEMLLKHGFVEDVEVPGAGQVASGRPAFAVGPRRADTAEPTLARRVGHRGRRSRQTSGTTTARRTSDESIR